MIIAYHNIYCVNELFYVKNNKSKKYGSNWRQGGFIVWRRSVVAAVLVALKSTSTQDWPMKTVTLIIHYTNKTDQ